jgi:pilus assembly protein CpaB
MNRKGWIPLVLGLVLAVGTAVATFVILQQQRQAAAAQAEALVAQQAAAAAPTLKLPVAARPLTPGMTLTEEDVLLKDFPVDLVPVSAITDTISLESQILAEPVGQGETFNYSQFIGETGSRASRKLAAGQVLFAYPINDLLSQSNVIEDGDRLDLMVTLPVANPDGSTIGPVTAFTLQNVTVFQVLRGPAESEDAVGATVALLLSVSHEQAVVLKHVKDSDGMIDFVLRPAIDDEPAEVDPMSRDELLERYQMR